MEVNGVSRIMSLVLLLAIAGYGGDAAGPEDSGVDDNDLAGTWRTDEVLRLVTFDLFPAPSG